MVARDWPARALYEDLYCARGEMENRIKEAQLELIADRLSAHAFRVNQLRLWLATFAVVFIEALRRRALARSELARASAQTIRLKLLKIGAVVTVRVRRVRLALSESCPHQAEFITACRALGVAASGRAHEWWQQQHRSPTHITRRQTICEKSALTLRNFPRTE